MHRTDARHLTGALLACLAIAVIGLWSWNTLAELFGAPEVQLRHAVATLALFVLCRFPLRRRRGCVAHRRGPGT